MEPLEAAIRTAITSGSYAEAERLFREYCSQLKTTDEFGHALQLIQWAFRLTSAARAHDASALRNLTAVSRYLRARPECAPKLQIDG